MSEKLNLTYTPEMEKAMHQSHGMNFSEYEMNIEKRLEVEKKREQSHRRGLEAAKEMDHDIHR
ncbi:hypothetical protein DES38_10535 [Streptohalobacillus salinus]|uniref:Uncharacterized protein n=1 Tax=Streptohalobacillus salinus TaxID=621096 RepID=A0A2V3WDA6_9BACI|nr:hypothetical protein [Streptohalobacillus salinus]PXW91416.1 hypothetical protein DES38_10535 [Streptohalobacillus salinus]